MSTTWESRLVVPVAEARDHIQGSADAPVTLVEYGDFQCPYCGRAYQIVKEVQARMGDRLRFVFRKLPDLDLTPIRRAGGGDGRGRRRAGQVLGNARSPVREPEASA